MDLDEDTLEALLRLYAIEADPDRFNGMTVAAMRRVVEMALERAGRERKPPHG